MVTAAVPTTTMRAHNLPGAPRALYLPSDIRVDTRIVTHPRTTSRRKATPKTSDTWHDTGNPRTNAEGEYAWLAGGRQGGSLGGYNSIFDDIKIIYCGYLDEETWHAGVQAGNLWSWGTEHAFGGNVNWNRSWEIGCAWHGGLMEMGNLNPDTVFRWHQFWTGKYCPGQIFNRGLQAATIARVKYYWTLARSARQGVTVPVAPGYATPMPPLVDGKVWDGQQDVIINGVKFEAQRITGKTTGTLNRRQWASTESQLTGAAFPAGASVELLGWVAGELVDGVSEWWVDVAGNRLWAGGIDAEPKVDPDYGQEPEETPGVIPINGRLYYPLHDEETGELGRRITVWQDGDLHKWADTSSAVVGEARKGEERIFRYWTRGEEIPLPGADGATEIVWYAEHLHSGARMWAGLSDERPD